MARRGIAAGAALVALVVVGALLARASSIEYRVGDAGVREPLSAQEDALGPVAAHRATPEPLRALYMTSWVAGTPSLREGIIELIGDTELNAIVIDIKDDTGRISYEVADPELHAVLSWEDRIPDLRELIERLHEDGVYVIGRISVFQDPFYTKLHPDLAVKRGSDGAIWKDRKGLSFIDVGAKAYWRYIVSIAEDAYAAGFDEINFDYVRFPSDGNMRDIYYPFSEERIVADPDFGKAAVLESFFSYLYDELKDSGAVLSVDLFGMTTTNADDLNIGQVLERALPYFDYVAPMVYPSHYPPNFNGWADPASIPYEIVKFSMDAAVRRARMLGAALDSTATSSAATALRDQARKGHGNVSASQLRPWLQDFDLGATYTSEMVRAQMQATYDTGLTSWSLWDAGNTYTRSALLPE